MEPITPDPKRLLEQWMEFERGGTPPGRILANLKTGGMRLVLEELAAAAPPAPAAPVSPTA